MMRRLNVAFTILVLLILATSCRQKGCTDPNACNYEIDARKDDGSCGYVEGCTDPDAENFDPEAICDDGSCKYPENFNLRIDFWNPSGSNPEIKFIASESAPEIRIDFDKTFKGEAYGSSFSRVIIDNVRIIDEMNNNYTINSITAYENRDNGQGGMEWRVDKEFKMFNDPVNNIDIAMVLDVSSSLEGNFANVKSYAKDFIDSIFTKVQAPRIAIVDFSTEINATELMTDKAAIFDYIDSLKVGEFTALYEAMNTGLNILEQSTADSKTMLTFTDGSDNNSDPAFTPTSIQNKLANPDDSFVSSFTIGLAGDVNRSVLVSLAANGGVAAFPNNSNELKGIFDAFSKSIANVYNLRYERNQQEILESNPAQLLFEFNAVIK